MKVYTFQFSPAASTRTHASRLLCGIIPFNSVDFIINTAGPCLHTYSTKYSRSERRSVRCTCTLSTSPRHTNPSREHLPTWAQKMLPIIYRFHDGSGRCVRLKDCVSLGSFTVEHKPVKVACSRLSCCKSSSGW